MKHLAWVLLLALTAAPAGAQDINKDELGRRRAALAAKFGDGACLVDAGPIKSYWDDAMMPVLDFKYLTGFHDDDGVLVLVGKRAFLFTSDRKAAAISGIKDLYDVDEFEAWAKKNLPKAGKAYTKLRQARLDIVKAAVKDVVGSKVGQELVRLRLVKSPTELKLLRKAADATCKAHVRNMKELRDTDNEKDVQTRIEETFKKEGCPDLGFPSICAAGKNGTILHYMENREPVGAGTLIVCDIGAATENYVTDITRTLPTSGSFSDEQRAAYQCVLDAQKAAEALLKPGATLRDLDRAAAKVFEQRGLTKWSYAHSKDSGVRHGLGHFVGMHVHDAGAYDTKFEPNMIITIEPGWYDKDQGWGIRIEDTYVVTAGGFDRLSKTAPREIDEIEKLMKR